MARQTPRLSYTFPDLLPGDTEIVRLYESGLVCSAVASIVGLTRGGVENRLHRLGVQLRPRGKFARNEKIAPREQVVGLYKEGLTARQIAERLGTNHRTVLNRLEKAGIERRQRWEKPVISVGELRALYAVAGQTCKEIGKVYGYTGAGIRTLLEAAGITRRRATRRLGMWGGSRNPNWKGGTRYFPYSEKFTTTLKEKIRVRDGRKCQLCGMTEREHKRRFKIHGKGVRNAVHHINYDKQDCREENLITLCHKCNVRVNFNREHWQQFFKQKMGVA